MILTLQQKETIFQYRDKSYICAILCQESSDWYNLLKTITNIPLIVISTSMSILNSLNINNYDMRIPNIVINATFALILSLINNFKISEKQANFRSLNIKYIKLTHFIEDKITNELDNCTKDDIRKIINDYDTLAENLDFSYPGFIKKKIKKRFYGKKTLPNILNCEVVFVNKKDTQDSPSPLIKYLHSVNLNEKKIAVLIDKNDKNDISVFSNLNNSTNSNNSNIPYNIITRTINIDNIKRQNSIESSSTNDISPLFNLTHNKDFSQVKFIEDLQT